MEIIKLNNKNLKEAVRIAEKFIKNGKIVVCPTDTVYGLVCDAKNKKAVAKIFKIKKRSWRKSLSLFVENLKMAKRVAKINKTQERFLKNVWPGQTIAVLQINPSTRSEAKGIISKEGKIGLRIPDYKLLNILLKEFGSSLAQTSANISGKPPAREIKEILKQFHQEKYLPDLILDGGKLKFKKPSQVIDLTRKKFKIIRE